MLFYDMEVFKYDWLGVFIDTDAHEKHVIVNDRNKLSNLYNAHIKDIWSGFNIKHYDQYIIKGIMLGMDPKMINDKIIIDGLDGWQISREFRKIPMLMYDVFCTKDYGLKTLEGFMGNNIKETDVPFDIDRPLTPQEIQQTVDYCTTDVERAIDVFLGRIDKFNAVIDIIKAFPEQCNFSNLCDTDAQITSHVLECRKLEHDDEFDFFFLPCLQLKKYKYVQDWFSQFIGIKFDSEYNKQSFYKSTSLTTEVTGVPHTFGFGGCHGAPSNPIHLKGGLFHVDVSNYYPSLLIAWDLITRNANNDNFKLVYKTRKELKYKQTRAKDKAESKKYKKMQLPYKLMLNALSGAMKDKGNQAYDPRNNNIMCINGQLMLLDLIEHLEVIPGFVLVQSNTDGLIVQIPDTDEAFNMLDDICYDWEMRCSTEECSILLETDQIAEIYQKDVNNYLWIDLDGDVERKGAYVKELNSLDYDLPIVNKALVDYMAKGIPVEKTINDCDDLIEFQKLVKLSGKYEYVEHNGVRYSYKCYRVFASKRSVDGKILKCRHEVSKKTGETLLKKDKFGNTPDNCFIDNESVIDKKVPPQLDKSYYIKLANKRLNDFGIKSAY